MPVLDILHFVRREFDRRPFCEGFGSRDQELVPVAGRECFLKFAQGGGVAQAETPALGAAQTDQVRAATQSIAQVIGEGTDIRA